MNGITWSFRDLAVHLFPGTLISGALFYVFREFYIYQVEETALLVLFFLISSYLCGVVIESVTDYSSGINNFVRKMKNDPLSGIFSKARNGDRFGFNEIAFNLVELKLGKNLVKTEKDTSLIYYMVREVESKNEILANFISRISSLENMCKNLSYSLFFNAIILALYSILNKRFDIIAIIVLSILIGFVLILARDKKRLWFGRVVTRSYISVNHEFVEKIQT